MVEARIADGGLPLYRRRSCMGWEAITWRCPPTKSSPLSLSLKRCGDLRTMRPQEARIGMKVRVCEHHRISGRRGMVGRIVDRYGGEEYVAVDVRFLGGQYRLFWPEDLEEIPSPRSWWRSLLGGESGG